MRCGRLRSGRPSAGPPRADSEAPVRISERGPLFVVGSDRCRHGLLRVRLGQGVGTVLGISRARSFRLMVVGDGVSGRARGWLYGHSPVPAGSPRRFPRRALCLAQSCRVPKARVVSETPQYGGTLVILHEHTPSNLGAWWVPHRFVDVQLARFAVENLVGLDAEGQPVPQLATGWEVDEAAKTVTFQLREGVKFHDGTDFDAEAANGTSRCRRTGSRPELTLCPASRSSIATRSHPSLRRRSLVRAEAVLIHDGQDDLSDRLRSLWRRKA